ncbi:hypothetical protein SynSYN20_01647 [Synechococcus sp. SYN20]|nr:hypothetical protein SynSYN20_01647 [Synechococcus sp. SYN20]
MLIGSEHGQSCLDDPAAEVVVADVRHEVCVRLKLQQDLVG